MAARTHDGRAFRILTILDEYTRECLSITVARRITSQEVIDQLAELFLEWAISDHIRSDPFMNYENHRVILPFPNLSLLLSLSAPLP